MLNLRAEKILEVLLLVGLCFAGINSQAAKCFEEAPLVECAGNVLKFYYDSGEETCMAFRAANCEEFLDTNYFNSFSRCQKDCSPEYKGDLDDKDNGSDSSDIKYNGGSDDGRNTNEYKYGRNIKDYTDGLFHFDCSQTRMCSCSFGMQENVQLTSVCLPCMCNEQAPIPNCDLQCPSGYVKNDFGDMECRCKETKDMCTSCADICQYGYESDGNGCSNCQCYQPRRGDRKKNPTIEGGSAVSELNELFLYDCSTRRECVCPYGEVHQDTSVCFPCLCNTDPPLANCDLECPAGYVENARGRLVCRCREGGGVKSWCDKCENFCLYGYRSYGSECHSCICYQPSY